MINLDTPKPIQTGWQFNWLIIDSVPWLGHHFKLQLTIKFISDYMIAIYIL